MKYEVNNEDTLLELAYQYENISFDIFDTLIMRKTLFPEDVFQIIEKKVCGKSVRFATFRKRAILENDTPNPNIYEIYEKYAELTGISADVNKEILNLELDIEKAVLIKRESTCRLLHELKKKGKKVYLITDMYLPKSFIEKVLYSLGITEYDDIFVSCEYRTLKCEELFKKYKEKYPDGSYLHIGDNMYSDIQCAENNGIDSLHIDSAITRFRNSEYAPLEQMAAGITERTILGMFISKLYNSPLGELEIYNMNILAELFVAPIAYGMVNRLFQVQKKEKFDKVLFAARDGFILKEIYELCGGNNGIYFYTSRKAVTITDIDTDHKMLWLANLGFEYKDADILSKVFLLEKNNEYNDKMSLNDNILKHRDEIIDRSKVLRQNYIKYIENKGINGGRYLFVDLVSSGTCQLYLDKIINGELEGFYLCKLNTIETAKNELHCYSVFPKCEIGDTKYAFYKEYFLLEIILTSLEPSLDYIDESGQPVFMAETRSDAERSNIKKIHESIKLYVRDLDGLCGHSDEADVMFIDKIFDIYIKKGSKCDINVRLKDDWMNRDVSINRLN